MTAQCRFTSKVSATPISTSRAAAPRRVADDFRPITAPELEADITEARERKEKAEPTDRAEPSDRIDPNEPTEPTEHAEPIEPIDRMEFLEPMQSSDPSDQSDQRDFTGPPPLC